jgi:hypothetical protein
MLPGSGVVTVVMLRVPTLNGPQLPTQVLTLNVPWELQAFSTSLGTSASVTNTNLVDVERKLNIARFSPRHSSKSQNNSPSNEPPVIWPVKE